MIKKVKKTVQLIKENPYHVFKTLNSTKESKTIIKGERLIVDETEVKQAVADYWQEIFKKKENHQTVPEWLQEIRTLEGNSIRQPISKEEVEESIHRAKANKAPGWDNISMDMQRY